MIFMDYTSITETEVAIWQDVGIVVFQTYTGWDKIRQRKNIAKNKTKFV